MNLFLEDILSKQLRQEKKKAMWNYFSVNCFLLSERTFLYNGVNNQQDATTFPFINLFKSAQNVSGDKFAHPQEDFIDCIQGVTGRMCETLGEFSLGQTIPI